eukprot:PhF_6_TR32169/c0_g1_i3/m.47733/K10251/HSD17B12, KAR, IFA38; 17beta-estradiol 17-dehydrogenase / very-long-chain 3-oxoacyl-CoA reductase
MAGCFSCCFEIVGLIFALYYLVKVALWVRVAFFVKADLRAKYGRGGKAPWAVVTGASDGIGKGFAIQLAKRGVNVCLVSRTKSKLDDVAAEIAKLNRSVETKTIAFDFSTATKGQYDALLKDLAGLDIGILVNNVGINYEYPEFFVNSTSEQNDSLVRVNIDAANTMTLGLLGRLNERKGGAIINLSSVSGYVPFSLLSVYAGTKAYNREFSLSLAGELTKNKIDVLTVTPNGVATNMHIVKKGPQVNVSPGPMASQCLNKVGFTNETNGHWIHDVSNFFLQFVPTRMQLFFLLKMRDMLKKS